MFEALKKIMAAAEELGTVEDVSVLDWPVRCPAGGTHKGKMIIITGKIDEELKFRLELQVAEQVVTEEQEDVE